jgi:hypothetical protein
MVDEHLGSAVFEEYLPAPPAGHQKRSIRVDTRECDEPAAATGMKGARHRTLGTET